MKKSQERYIIKTYFAGEKNFRTGVCREDGVKMARQHYGHKKHMNKFTIMGIVLLCAVLCFTILYRKSALEAQCKEYNAQITELKKEKKSVDERTEELKKFEKYIDTDEYVEKIARERLGLVYKGEIIFEPDDAK